MVVGKTTLAKLINPEVMADMISAKLPNAIRFAPLAHVETKLVGQAGDTLTVPKFTYIGDATDVAEGEPIPLDQLGTTKSVMKIKKAAKGIEITDEAVLSGLGDPIGEGSRQLLMAIANKVDNDILALAKTATQKATAAPTTVANLQAALDIFNDEDTVNYVMVMNPADAAKLRADAGQNWLSGTELGAQALVTGAIGEVLGVQIVRSRKLAVGEGFIVAVSAENTEEDDDARYGAFVINLKRNAQVESDRDIVRKTTVVTADEHYGVYLYDDTKVVRFGA